MTREELQCFDHLLAQAPAGPRMADGGILCCDDWFSDRDWLAAGAINAVAQDWPLAGTAGRKAWWVA